MGDVRDDSSPEAMRASRPSWLNYAKPTGSCQLPAASRAPPTSYLLPSHHPTCKQSSRKRKDDRPRQARPGQGRAGPEVATGWHSGTGKLREQGQGVGQGWHVSPLQPRDLDAGPPGQPWWLTSVLPYALLNEAGHSGRFDGP